MKLIKKCIVVVSGLIVVRRQIIRQHYSILDQFNLLIAGYSLGIPRINLPSAGNDPHMKLVKECANVVSNLNP